MFFWRNNLGGKVMEGSICRKVLAGSINVAFVRLCDLIIGLYLLGLYLLGLTINKKYMLIKAIGSCIN